MGKADIEVGWISAKLHCILKNNALSILPLLVTVGKLKMPVVTH